MRAIVSLLDKKHYRNLENLWRELEYECGLSGINLTPLPHFTWHLAAEYDFDRLGDKLPELVQSSSPFTELCTDWAINCLNWYRVPVLSRCGQQVWVCLPEISQ